MVETFAAETESEPWLSWRIKEDPSLRNWLLGREEEEKGKEGKGKRGPEGQLPHQNSVPHAVVNRCDQGIGMVGAPRLDTGWHLGTTSG